MGKTINEIRKHYGLELVPGGDSILINRIEKCHNRCSNYLVIKFERLKTNNICNGCKMKNSKDIKELLKKNERIEEYKKKMEEALYEM